jgi:hypothetical protein
VVYSLSPHKVAAYGGEVEPNTFCESDILSDFNARQEARVHLPGLYTEEYQWMMKLFIKNLFHWAKNKQAMAWFVCGSTGLVFSN